MAIRLTNHFNPGDMDAGNVYDTAKIVSVTMILYPQRQYHVEVAFGYDAQTNAGLNREQRRDNRKAQRDGKPLPHVSGVMTAWKEGKVPRKRYTFSVADLNTQGVEVQLYRLIYSKIQEIDPSRFEGSIED